MRAVLEECLGEDRAMVFDGGRLVEAHIERPGVRAGDIWDARLTAWRGGRAYGVVGGEDALIARAPHATPEGALIRVIVLREAIAEARRARAVKADWTGTAAGIRLEQRAAGADLRDRLVSYCHDVDIGPVDGEAWDEAIEQARTGLVPFPGGQLVIDRTAAGVVIDVDGDAAALPLALAAAEAVAAAIARFDLAGSILVDFPTLGDAAARRAVAEAFDAAAPAPFAPTPYERTAINGFGLMQVVRARVRPSFLDRVQGEATITAALELVRQAARRIGAVTLVAGPALIDWLGARPDLTAELARRVGGRVALRAVGGLAISGGYVESQ